MRKTIFPLLCIGAHAFTTPSSTSTTTSPRRIVAVFSSTAEAPAGTTGGGDAEAPAPAAGGAAIVGVGVGVGGGADDAPPAGTTTTGASATSGGSVNTPTWAVKQHLYGLDMINESSSESSSGAGMSVTLGADGEEVGSGGGGEEKALPLPQTYITCGKCKSLFAIAEEDLGDKGKGCRVKCTVCDNSWYQSRDRLFDIPNDSHDFLPAQKSHIDRIARNLARDIPPAFMGVNKLYVGNLDWTTSPDDLLNFFETNAAKNNDGKDISVCDVSVVSGPDGRSRGFAFVSFYDEVDGKAALACDGMECNGRELSVREPNN